MQLSFSRSFPTRRKQKRRSETHDETAHNKSIEKTCSPFLPHGYRSTRSGRLRSIFHDRRKATPLSSSSDNQQCFELVGTRNRARAQERTPRPARRTL